MRGLCRLRTQLNVMADLFWYTHYELIDIETLQYIKTEYKE